VVQAVVLPDVALKACDRPRPVPDRDLTAGEVHTNWGADRAALIICETRRAAAVAAVSTTNERTFR